LLGVVFVLGVMSGMMVTAHASPIAQQKLAISAAAAGAFVSYLALGMVAGKVMWGALSDRLGRLVVLLSVLTIAVAALILLWQTNTYALVVIGIFAVGLCYGGFLALIGPMTSEAFGHKHFAVNFGIMYLSVAVASFGGPRLAATIAETEGGDYSLAFLVAAILTVVGLSLATTYAWWSKRSASIRRDSPEVL
jgi:OFA family oxalate/formate antiporter-like MFS transporter